MKFNDVQLLEEAYLSITKKVPVASDEDKNLDNSEPQMTPEVEVGPMDGPALSEPEQDMSPACCSGASDSMGDDNSLDMDQEEEEDQMTISNLNSIRESITKVAMFCASGKHLEIWAQQKLAIAMDNLAEVARRVN
jgi:hypothetical protein